MSLSSNSAPDAPHQDASQQEYMGFTLGAEEYAVEILRVQEIRGWEAVTRVPNSPDYVKGVLNLRGTIVPMIDLRQRLGLPFRAYEKETVVIVLRAMDGRQEKNIGVAVDRISGVLSLDADEVQAAPDFGERLNTELISGLARAHEKMVMLLDVDRLQRF